MLEKQMTMTSCTIDVTLTLPYYAVAVSVLFMAIFGQE